MSWSTVTIIICVANLVLASNICPKNEVPTSCIEAVCEYKSCCDIGKPIDCIKMYSKLCTKGCLCKDTYLRAENGTCIPADQCPLDCYGENEVSGCYSTCPQTCESIGTKCSCSLQGCKPECRCKDGFYRNKIGECISKEDCLKCMGPNEYFSCGGLCDNVCKTLRYQNQSQCVVTNSQCYKMCYCEEGYARDSNKVCIPISKCPPTCGVNEIYDVCPTCPPKTCDCIGKAIKCQDYLKPGDPDCKPACRCIDDYYRNKYGVCIPKNKCPRPKVCGINEVYSKCVNGGCGRWNCSQPEEICMELVEGACKEGCQCKDGFLRADNDTCIPADQCPLICSGKNEVSGCYSNCAETCESIGDKCVCSIEDCIPECRCEDGFYRNKIGECIPKKDCFKCTGPYEYFSYYMACDNVCATLVEQNQTNCPMPDVYKPMCYCEEGYARDYQNICVPISKCPPSKCKTNEVFDICPPICPAQRCDVDPRAISCEPNPQPGDPRCKPGCRCIKTYLKNKYGDCVPKDQCYKGPYIPPKKY